MRFLTYKTEAGEGVGLRVGEGYRGLPTAVLGGDLKAFLGDADATAGLARKLSDAPAVDLDVVELLTPIPRPNKILCIGLNYVDHSAESGFEPPTYPTVFARFANSLVGHGAPWSGPMRPTCSTTRPGWSSSSARADATSPGRRPAPRRRLHPLQRRVGARLPDQVAAMDDGQGVGRHRRRRA